MELSHEMGWYGWIKGAWEPQYETKNDGQHVYEADVMIGYKFIIQERDQVTCS